MALQGRVLARFFTLRTAAPDVRKPSVLRHTENDDVWSEQEKRCENVS